MNRIGLTDAVSLSADGKTVASVAGGKGRVQVFEL